MSTPNEIAKNNGALMTPVTPAVKFIEQVSKHWAAELGESITLSPFHKVLAQHLFIKADQSLKAAQAKSNKSDEAPFEWKHVNITKFAVDAVHRVSMGLDALIPNHLHMVPYWNKRQECYDINIQIGYVGLDMVHRKHGIDPPSDVVYRMVHEGDHFLPIYKDRNNPIETYEFSELNPFEPGNMIGAFGYISYDEPGKNRLVIVTMRDFKKSRAAAKSNDFWGPPCLLDGITTDEQGRLLDRKFFDEMVWKTAVARIARKIPLDPEKVNPKTLLTIQREDPDSIEAQVSANAALYANKDVIDASYGSQHEAIEEPVHQQQSQAPPLPPVEDKRTNGKPANAPDERQQTAEQSTQKGNPDDEF